MFCTIKKKLFLSKITNIGSCTLFKIIVRRYQGLIKLKYNSQTFIISFVILNPLSIVLRSIKLFKKSI